MTTLLIVVASLVGLLVVLLCIPVTVRLSIKREDAPLDGEIQVFWLFGLVRFRSRIAEESAADEAVKKTSEERVVTKTQTKKKKRDVSGLAMFRQPSFRGHVLRFLRRFFRATHTHDLLLKMRIGFDDPADTGLLWGVIGPLSGIAQSYQGAEIQISPDFSEEVFWFLMRGSFRLFPLQFVGLGVMFVLSPTSIRAWRAAKTGEW